MKKVGILGGTRFIGYHLARKLIEEGHDVTLFNRGKTTPPGPLEGCRRIFGDRNRPAQLKAFFENRYDAVFDLTAFVPNQVQPLLDHYQDRIGHYVFCSTPMVNKTPGSYCGNKALIEGMLSRAKVPSTVVRPQLVFGSHDLATPGHVFARLRHGFAIAVRPEANGRINPLYIKDLTLAFSQILANPKSAGKAYNLACDEVVNFRELVALCGAVAGYKPEIKVVDPQAYPQLDLTIGWHPYDVVAQNTEAKSELGLQFTPLRKALEETWGYYQTEEASPRPVFGRAERHAIEERAVPWVTRFSWKVTDNLKPRRLKQRLKKLLKR